MTSLRQDVWWTTADGLTHLIKDLEDRHRVNIAAWLIDNAARTYKNARFNYLFWYYPGPYAPDDIDPLTEEEIHRWIRREMDKGKHLDHVRYSPLFRRMIQGIEGQLKPGTLGA